MMVGSVLFSFILLLGTNLYAQNDEMTKTNDTYKQNALKWTTQLSQKVTLTEDQEAKIEGVLVDYQGAGKSTDVKDQEQLQTTYNSKIESVLNDNQKTIYKDYSKEWWKNMSEQTIQSKDTNKY